MKVRANPLHFNLFVKLFKPLGPSLRDLIRSKLNWAIVQKRWEDVSFMLEDY